MKEETKNNQLDMKSLPAIQIIDAMGDGISVQDTDFKVLYQNQAHIKMAMGEFVGEYCYKAYAHSDKICKNCPVAASFKDGNVHSLIKPSPPDRDIPDIEIKASPLKDTSGRIIAGIEIVRDISERIKTDARLAESEERYRELFDNAHDLIQSVSPDGKFIYVNNAWLQTMGYTMKELQSITMFDLIDPSCMGHCMELFKKVMSGEPQRNIEAIFIAKDGHKVEVEGNVGCRIIDGNPGATHGIFRDITERKKSEYALIFNEERYRSLVESTEDSIYLLDRDCKYLFMNKHHIERLGLAESGYAGKGYGDLHSAEDTESFAKLIDKVCDTGESSQQEYKYKGINDDRHLHFIRTLSPVKDKDGKVTAVTVLSKNITSRKRFEFELQMNEERYRSLVESTEDSIYLVDKNYKYLFMNKKHISRMGLLDYDFKDHSYVELHSPKETKEFIKLIDEVFDTGLSIQMDHKSSRDDMYFLRTLSPVRDKDGKVIAVTVISKNISDRKRMEEELRTLSITDELTALYNRRGFLMLAGQQLKLANRLKRGVLIFYADLDDLKIINDKYGHQEGDRAISETANLLREVFRESDIIARIGGDEFVVFPVHTTGYSTETLSARFKEHLRVYNTKRSAPYDLSISIGIAYYEKCSHSIEELLVQADKLMYEQKKEKQKK
ncbi:MAG: PAS domain S-box protein [Thermodesulfovibrionia bacterium]|nr:PAS domain S-box protein [Thermodesulfovibrionia bacterium]